MSAPPVPPPPTATKKLVGASMDSCAADALEGLVAVNPALRLLGKTRNVVREDLEEIRGKVAVVCGGGSGHEPFAAGYVGTGMLAAAVPGPIFASPPPHQAYPLFLHLAQFEPTGILMFVFNYTGDRLNFGLAVERAKRDGVNVEMFVNGEDRANTGAKMAGRRGMAGNMFLLKIAGAMAEEGATMSEIVDELTTASASLGSIGVCLSPCSLPGQPPLFALGPNDMELGLGVHGEAGVSRMQVKPVSDVISTMLAHMSDESNENRLAIDSEDEVALMINNLGGTSKLEELIVCREAIDHLEHHNVGVLRAYNGHIMTSLEMAGVQLSVLKLGPDEARKKKWLQWLDAPTDAPAWPRVSTSKKSLHRFTPCRMALVLPPGFGSNNSSSEFPGAGDPASGCESELILLSEFATQVFENALQAAAEALRYKEYVLNELDSGAGDGDCGSTICRGVNGIMSGVADGSVDLRRPRRALAAMSDVCAAEMGGCSGALYSLFFAGAARSVVDAEQLGRSVSCAASSGGGGGGGGGGDAPSSGSTPPSSSSSSGLKAVLSKALLSSLSSSLSRSTSDEPARPTGVAAGAEDAAGDEDVPSSDLTQIWIDAFAAGVENVQKYGGAEPGDRTMLDALVPALEVLRTYSRRHSTASTDDTVEAQEREAAPADSVDVVDLLRRAAAAAQAGADSTAGMRARAGRASYVAAEKLVRPDPGATAVAVWTKAVCDALVVAASNCGDEPINSN